MDLDSDQKKLVDQFVKQELLIGELYRLFAMRYFEYRDFWTTMAVEENQHAALLKRMVESDTNNRIILSNGELRSSSLDSSINNLHKIISEFEDDINFPISRAVVIALQLEKSLWERKVFQYFEGDSEDVRKIMTSLNLEQEIHIKKIDRFASRFKK